MAYAIDTYPGDGVTTNFNVTYPYILKSHVKVYIDGALQTDGVGYTWFSDTVIQMTTPPAVGQTLKFQRATSPEAKMVDFNDASTLTEANIDRQFDQAFYNSQEALDGVFYTVRLDTDDKWDGQNKVLKSLSDPTTSTDAATKNYVDQAFLGTLLTPLGISNGGTGATTAPAARVALGVPSTGTVAFEYLMTSGASNALRINDRVTTDYFTIWRSSDVVNIWDTSLGANIASYSGANLTFKFHVPVRLTSFADPTDTTKRVSFNLTGITTASTRDVTFPDVNVTIPYKPGTFGSHQVFTAGGTWTKPAGLKRVKVTTVGAGGGAAGAAATAAGEWSCGAGGAAGGISVKVIEAASLGATETVTVGAAGTSSAGASGTAGGTSSFGAHCSATGGAGGTASAAGADVGADGSVGGTGSGGDINGDGAPGGSAIAGAASNTNKSGEGGSSIFGGGGPSRAKSTGIAGVAATGYGSGGSGAVNSPSNAARAGGNGKGGIVIVEEFF